MKEYDVKITETLEKTVTVQAESHDAAEEQVRAAYYNSEYILDSENFTGWLFPSPKNLDMPLTPRISFILLCILLRFNIWLI